jgi:hypothetical protein
LQNEFERINYACFENKLPTPSLKIKRNWLPHDPPGGGQTVAHYKSTTKKHPAEISLFPLTLLNKNDARTALAHEMIHHWEATTEERFEDQNYPPTINYAISRRFLNARRERHWRSTHSSQFINKACAMSSIINVAVEELLFKEK